VNISELARTDLSGKPLNLLWIANEDEQRRTVYCPKKNIRTIKERRSPSTPISHRPPVEWLPDFDSDNS